MEEFVKFITSNLARVAETTAAIIIGIASLRAFYCFLRDLIIGKSSKSREDVRLTLGRSLALSLEFLLAADILKTAVAPSWNDIGMLAAIAVLRTALNFFLDREIRSQEQRNTSDPEMT